MTSVTPLKIFIEDYSDKAFVVRGETKEHKDVLKTLGGKWNSNLKGSGGWIFSKARKEDVERYLSTGVVQKTVQRIEKPLEKLAETYTKNLKIGYTMKMPDNDCMSGISLSGSDSFVGRSLYEEPEIYSKIREYVSKLSLEERLNFVSIVLNICNTTKKENDDELQVED